uniref:zinc ribbon domain-containing protein n=1 Tax=Variovorax sp. BK018 TaxID=3450241 RepID=UPI0040398CA2
MASDPAIADSTMQRLRACTKVELPGSYRLTLRLLRPFIVRICGEMSKRGDLTDGRFRRDVSEDQRTAKGIKVQRPRNCHDWLACIPNPHAGYITWDWFEENLKLLESNGRNYGLARASPPREGPALLQGRAVCGNCGRHMRVRYAARRGRMDAWYVCDREQGRSGEPHWQSIGRKCRLHHGGQAIKALPHVGMSGHQSHPGVGRQADHRA